jgi:DnaJ-class molecular chaperone
MKTKDYYETLEVTAKSSSQEIKEAYRRLAFQYHPDRNPGPAALEKMKEINEAYAVLSDETKRRTYDRLQAQYGPLGYDRFRQSYSEQDIFRGSDINAIFEELARAFGFRNFEEVFRDSYGPGFRTFEFGKPGFFGRGFIFVGAGLGRRADRVAPDAPGLLSGTKGKFTRYLLQKLLGFRDPQKGTDWRDTITLNPEEARAGGKVDFRHWRRSKDLAVNISPGTRDGQIIRLRGMGAEGKNGGEGGDLYLKVQVRRSLLRRARRFLKI